MLTNKALHTEILAIETMIAENKYDIKYPMETAQLKIGTLVLKLLLSIRTNQVLVMKKMGVQPIEPAIRRQEPAAAASE